MPKIIAKILVSNPKEIDFVRLNAFELLPLVDEFLITEANYDNFGKPHESRCAHFKDFYPLDSPKVKYLYMDIHKQVRHEASKASDLHHNEQAMRDGFVQYLHLKGDDIVISMDADEVIFNQKAKKFINRLNRRFNKRSGYVLRLHQFVYKANLCWTNCDFRGPVITRASVYLDKVNAQWRYEGFPTYFKSGTHFSWVMDIDSMLEKIATTSHSIEYSEFARRETLEKAIADKIWIFDQNRSFKTKTIKNFSNYRYPRMLKVHSNKFYFTNGLDKE